MCLTSFHSQHPAVAARCQSNLPGLPESNPECAQRMVPMFTRFHAYQDPLWRNKFSTRLTRQMLIMNVFVSCAISHFLIFSFFLYLFLPVSSLPWLNERKSFYDIYDYMIYIWYVYIYMISIYDINIYIDKHMLKSYDSNWFRRHSPLVEPFRFWGLAVWLPSSVDCLGEVQNGRDSIGWEFGIYSTKGKKKCRNAEIYTERQKKQQKCRNAGINAEMWCKCDVKCDGYFINYSIFRFFSWCVVLITIWFLPSHRFTLLPLPYYT